MVADAGADLALDHIGELVLPLVHVRWNENTRLDRVLDSREDAARLLPGHSENGREAAERDAAALVHAA